ncbi:glycine cleavage system protein GcvH [candidate division WOR-3 bacterium]|uniref:Glycine cleavage system H protein n=1 Tax=candidate division WOR-3 bacterium TaxID=2052148 RepID=A0A9D5K8F7_UNCW3|nr:glycine cleavage system protein GcvH [candidate division WOR-3 bacterium]MBD3364217.1 glycine cleavage system protein GcvH [candidate division WOR-3 bacterium]
MSEVPEDLRYTKTHEWVRTEGTKAVIGITDFAQGELSDIVMVEAPQVGREIKKEEAMGVIEAVKAVSDLYSPISGKVIEVNPKLGTNPETINQDPFGEGWIVKVEMADPKEFEKLMDASGYKEFLAAEGH